MNGHLVGYWRLDGHRHSFRYDETWLAYPGRRPISLSIPLVQGTGWASGPAIENYFGNLLPDNQEILNRLAAKFRTRSSGAFDLLEQMGRDCVGAIQFLPKDAIPPARQINAEPISDSRIAELLDSTISGRPFPFDDEDNLRISIAGAQEKTALLRLDNEWLLPRGGTPTTHILKMPLGRIAGGRVDFSSSIENEWLCLKLARSCGFNTPNAEIVTFGRHKTLAVERFDRQRYDRWIARLPQEDLCQARGIPSTLKYERDGGPGMTAILDTLRGSRSAILDRATFTAAQLFFWMLAAPDGHAKNFSIFHEAGDRFRATPLYDVMSAWPVTGNAADQFALNKLKMAMAVRTERNAHYKVTEILPRHWFEFAKRNAIIGFPAVAGLVVNRVHDAITEVANVLPDDFPRKVSDAIFSGLTRQAGNLAPHLPRITPGRWIPPDRHRRGLAGAPIEAMNLIGCATDPAVQGGQNEDRGPSPD